MTLKSLEDSDKEKLESYFGKPREKGNGVACPICREELYDSNPNMVLTSYPPRTEVSCRKCDYRGTRII